LLLFGFYSNNEDVVPCAVDIYICERRAVDNVSAFSNQVPAQCATNSSIVHLSCPLLQITGKHTVPRRAFEENESQFSIGDFFVNTHELQKGSRFMGDSLGNATGS
jgi:hypothetical protein